MQGSPSGGGGGWGALLKSYGQTPDTRASCRTGVVHGRRAPRQEWSMGGEHQDRSGPWEESTKTGVVHGRRASRQEWSMGGEHQEVVQKTVGHRVHFTAFAAGFAITFWTAGSDTGSKEETDFSEKRSCTN